MSSEQLAILMLVLVIPALGLLTRWLNGGRQTGMSAGTRRLARVLLWMVGAVEMLLGGMMAATGLLAFWNQGWNSRAGIPSVVWIVIGILLISTAAVVWAVARQQEGAALSSQQQNRSERWIRTLAVLTWVLMMLPLLPIAIVFIALASKKLAIGGMTSSLTRRGRQGRLLLTLAQASRLNLPLPLEIDRLAATESRRRRPALHQLADSLRAGIPLSQGLADLSLLPLPLCAEIELAETTGTMAETLESLGEHQLRLLRTAPEGAGLSQLTTYLWMTMCVMLPVLFLLVYQTFPRLKMIWRDFGFDIHSSMTLVDFVADYWYLVLPLACLPLALLTLLTVALGELDSRRLLPLLASWPRLLAPQLLDSFSRAARSHAPLEACLAAWTHQYQGTGLSPRLGRVQEDLDAGVPLAEALRRENVITSTEAATIQQATKVGHLAWGLQAVSRRIVSARRRRLRLLEVWLRPACVFAIGGVVLGIAYLALWPYAMILS